MALKMGRNASRGALYTEFGVTIRCLRKDLTAQSVTLHYLSDGTCTLRFVIRKQEFLVPVVIILKVCCCGETRQLCHACVDVAPQYRLRAF
jgi:DNA-directed RNA polymerase I subunit RPA2